MDAALKTVAYLRVSTRSQDLANQKLAILEFSQKRRFTVDQFIESRISSRKSPLERRIDEMLGTLQPGDRLLVSELSRLGRSLSQVIRIVETLVRRKIRFIAIKEAIEFDGKQDLRTKVMIAAASYVVFQHECGRYPSLARLTNTGAICTSSSRRSTPVLEPHLRRPPYRARHLPRRHARHARTCPR